MRKATHQTEDQNIADTVYSAKQSGEHRNVFIQNYMPFIIKSVCGMTKKYITIGDSDELSIGLMAFNEAIDRYDVQKGPFLAYAKLIIASRLKTYLEHINRQLPTEPIEQAENIAAFVPEADDPGILRDEIELWKKELLKFQITFRELLENGPKHKDTRTRAFTLSEKISHDHEMIQVMFDKYRLPITKIHQQFKVSVKVIETSKTFIISVVIIFVKELGAIKRWMLRNASR